jgi:hypothetical protein
VDLFEPGSGSQVHDFNGGIPASGLFWTVEIDDDAFEIGRGGRHATLEVEEAPVIDSFTFLGPNQIPASISFQVRWEATGPPATLGSGAAVAPTDPAAFLARFSAARATGSFSGTELGFSFKSDPGANSDRGYAELGRERNGAFLS